MNAKNIHNSQTVDYRQPPRGGIGPSAAPNSARKQTREPSWSCPPALDLPTIDELTGGHLGHHDVMCPLCGPSRRSPANQRRRVLRIWRLDPSFAGFLCARCGERGFAREGSFLQPDPAVLEQARREANERERLSKAERLALARCLWSKHVPIAGTIAETYLREARGYGGPLLSTLGFLPARGKHTVRR